MKHFAAALGLVLLCGLHTVAAMAEQPAALRLQVHLDAAVIKVSDLWSDAGAKGDAVIGPAPPPGHSIAIEAGQLVYIARLYDVNWRAVSGVERSAVERASRPLTREEITAPLQRSLVDAGASASASVDLATIVPMLVPPSSFPLVMVEAMAYDAATEHFSANIAASSDGMATQRMRVSGRVVHMVTAVVANRRLQPGDVIASGDVRLAQIGERRLAGPVASDLAQVLGQSPKHTLVAGQPLAEADIGAPVMVSKGETVVIVVETPSMYLALQGLAMSAGGRDDIIQVMNPLSRSVVAARVSGPGRAVIAPGSLPLTPAAGSPPRNPEISN